MSKNIDIHTLSNDMKCQNRFIDQNPILQDWFLEISPDQISVWIKRSTG